MSTPTRARIDAVIHEIDRRLAAVLGEVLHHPAIQRLESLWRGLHRLVTHTRPHENIRIDLLCVAKHTLHDDFLRADELAHSGLHHIVYTRAYASHGGQPYGLLCATFDFGPDPDDDPTRPLHFRELVDHREHLLWGHASLLVAMRAAEAFAEQRWCLGLVGTRSGPTLLRLTHPVPTSATLEVVLAPRSERALAEAGLLALTVDRASGRAILREAPTLQHSSTRDDLGTQLPYVLLVGRLAHYLQRVQREHVGQWDDRNTLQRELDLWLRQYVADMDDPPPEVRARKPLRRASIALAPVDGHPGWHRCHLRVVPHLTHLGRPLTLELIGRLDLGPR